MRISRLSIHNFRSIENLEIDLPQVCAFVGPNNTGKSNILLALRRVLERGWLSADTFSEDDVIDKSPDKDIHIGLTVVPPIPYSPYVAGPQVGVERLHFKLTKYKTGEKKGRLRLELQCSDAKDKPYNVPSQAPKKGVKTPFKPLIGIPGEIREQLPLIYIGADRQLKDQLPSAKYSMLRYLLEDIDRDFNDPNNIVTFPKGNGEAQAPRSKRFQDFLTAAMKLMRTEKFESLEKSIKQFALAQLGLDVAESGEAIDFFFGPFTTLDFYRGLDLLVKDGTFTTSATNLGGGIQNALVLAVMKAFEERRKEGAIILIEEPEMFLHPQRQRSLYKTLCEIGKTNQVIYTTHSPHFVAIPEYDRVGLVCKIAARTVVTFSSLSKTPPLEEKLRKEFDPERNELFFARRVLLVEGDTEKLALPEFAKRLNLDIDGYGATIVEVGGKRQLPDFAKIVKSFNVPVGVLYDKDSDSFKDSKDEEAFNKNLEALATSDGKTRVWQSANCYEDVMRQAMGEKEYLAACESYSGCSKAVRQRLIAAHSKTVCPPMLKEILEWLVPKEPRSL